MGEFFDAAYSRCTSVLRETLAQCQDDETRLAVCDAVAEHAAKLGEQYETAEQRNAHDSENVLRQLRRIGGA